MILTVLTSIGETATPARRGAGCNSYIHNYYGSVYFKRFCSTRNNILDVVLANDPFIVQSVEVGAPFANSDHCIIPFTLHVADCTSYERTETHCKRYIWDKADFVGRSDRLIGPDIC